MTELFIDGVAAVLPLDFSVQVKRENPLITKNGEYTYDVTLDLTNATNAELYRHLNRLNTTQKVDSKRSAVLVADNRVYCNGTEIITGWTEKTVTIQIASGNSELNYFIGSELLISSLKMKSTVLGSGENDYIEKTYPEVDYCLAPVVNQAAGYCVNKWALQRKDASEPYQLVADDIYWYAQPYLCAYIKEVLRGVGYELIVNQLEDTPFKALYICHVEEVVEWNKMLPGWSVKEFLEEIEKLFNAVFVVDNRKRTAKLLVLGTFFRGTATAHLQQIDDVYEVEVDDNSELDTNAASNIKYNFPDTPYWRWRCLPDNILNSAKNDTIPADYVPTKYARLQEWFMAEEHHKTDTIYTDLLDGRQYLYVSESKGMEIYSMLNEFAPLKREGVEVTIELDMMPVEMGITKIYSYSNGYSNDMRIWLPVIGEANGSSPDESAGQPTLAEQIENNTQKADSESKKNIYLAFYTGLAEYKALGGMKYQYPIPYTDEYRPAEDDKIPAFFPTNSVGASLRLVTLDNLFYQGGYDIDYTNAVKITLYDPTVYDTRLVFEARNKRYICKEMEFTLDASGRKGAWVGTFYPIRISDTEAENRWILTDGKWRDGGVWLDNGRWMDE